MITFQNSVTKINEETLTKESWRLIMIIILKITEQKVRVGLKLLKQAQEKRPYETLQDKIDAEEKHNSEKWNWIK